MLASDQGCWAVPRSLQGDVLILNFRLTLKVMLTIQAVDVEPLI